MSIKVGGIPKILRQMQKIGFNLTSNLTPSEGEVSWNSEAGTLSIGMPGGNVRLQVGQEELIRVKASENILNGQSVYVDGALGINPTISLAKADTLNGTESVIAMATEDIDSGQLGYVTTFGLVRNVDTSGCSEGDIIFLSGTEAGSYTTTEPDYPYYSVRLGYCLRSSATEGVILININSDAWKHAQFLTKEPTGFDDPSAVTITGDSSTRTVTLTGDFRAYYKGIYVSDLTDGYTSPAHPDTRTSLYFLIYDGTDISWKDTSDLTETYYSDLLIAWTFYNGTSWLYERECHGLMQWQTHRAEHRTIGTYKQSGGGLTDYTLESTTIADRRPGVEATLIYDEDLPTTNAALTAGGNYTQFYLSGADGTANFLKTATDIIPLSGTQPYYNQFTGGVWQQTLMSTGYYQSIWLLAIPMAADTESQKLRYVWVQGQTQNQSLDDEQALTPNSVNLGKFQLAAPEIVYIGRIIIRYIGGNWQLIDVDSLDGTRYSQTTSPQGNFLTTVTSDSTLEGLGTTSSPLAVDTDVIVPYTGATTDLDLGNNDLIVYDDIINQDPNSYDFGYSNVHDNNGYNKEYITDQVLYNCKIQGSSIEESGSLRVINDTFYIYLNGQWNEIVNNFRFREDDKEEYELEHRPIGFNWWYEIMSGNSNELGFNGLPLVQQYRTTMGAYPVPMEFDGGTF